MESIQSRNLDLNSENNITELSETELDQINGGLFWLAVLAGIGIARKRHLENPPESAPALNPTIPTVGGFVSPNRNAVTIGY